MTSSEIVDSLQNKNELVFTPYEGPLLKLYQQDVLRITNDTEDVELQVWKLCESCHDLQ